MSTSSAASTVQADDVSDRAPVVRLPVSWRSEPADRLGHLLDLVRAAAVDTTVDADAPADDELDEFAAQDLALAGESADLRARAARYASILGAGRPVGAERIDDVLRAFRSYEPFLGERDRALNAAAYRRLDLAARAPREAA